MPRNPALPRFSDRIRNDDERAREQRNRRIIGPPRAFVMEGPIDTDRYFPGLHFIDVGGARRLHGFYVACATGDCTISFRVNGIEIASQASGTEASPEWQSLGGELLSEGDYVKPVIQSPSGDCEHLTVSWQLVR